MNSVKAANDRVVKMTCLPLKTGKDEMPTNCGLVQFDSIWFWY